MAVLDASAVLALIADEPGADGVVADLEALGIAVEPVTVADAAAHAALRRVELTATGGLPAGAGGHRRLSLGDRCCLALAHRLGVPAITADRDWHRLELPVDIVTIR